MKLTESTRLRVEDFQKQRDWISPLLEAYNAFLGQSIRLLNKGLFFTDNIAGIEHDFDFTFQTQATTFPVNVSWPYDRFPPRHLFVTYATEEGASVAVAVTWGFNDARLIQLKSVYKFTTAPAISDLTAGNDYKVRVRVEP